MIDWLNDNSGAVQAVSVAVLAFVTASYAWFTRQMVNEMRESRSAQTRPYVVVDIENTRHTLCDMVIKNIGNSPAIGVEIAFEPEQMYYDTGKTLSGLPIFSQMKFVVPGREYRFFFKQLVGEDIDPLKETFNAKIRYSDTAHNIYSDTIPLNPYLRWDLLLIDDKGMDDLVKAVVDTAKQTGKIADRIGELERTVRWEMRARVNTPSTGADARSQVLAKLAEIREFWRSLFDPDVKPGGIYHSPSLFQARFHQLAMDVVALADGWEPTSKDGHKGVDKAFLQHLSEDLFDISAMDMYLGGGASVKAFQERGNSIALAIEGALA